MRPLDVFSILCIALMTGNELAVSLFINPAMERLEASPRTYLASLLARRLGKAMPFWYAASAILLCLEAWLHRSAPGFDPLLCAAILMVATILFTVTILVPINNRIAALSPASSDTGWHALHRKWDALHRIRIVALTLASACLVFGLGR